MKRTGGVKKLRATHTTESDCSARWMADAIRSGMAWKLPTRKSRKWPGKELGIARRFHRITEIGLPRTPLGKRDRARAAVHEASFKKAMNAHLKIVFGTDIGGRPPTEPIPQQIPPMARFSTAPMASLPSATSLAPETLGINAEGRVDATRAVA